MPKFAFLPERLKNRSQIFLLILVMTSVVLVLGGTIIMTLFFSSAEANKRIMTTFAENQANQIRSIVQLSHDSHHEGVPSQAVMDYIKFSYEKTPPITETAEVLFVYRDGDKIHFLSRLRFADEKTPLSYPLTHPIMEPMRLAYTQGGSGLVFATDYRGMDVLAAYAAVEGTNLAVMTKIDVAEVRGPFVETGIAAGVASIVLICIGIFLFHRIGDPLVARLEENETKYRTLFESANEGVLVISDRIEECNDRASQLLGYTKEEMVGSTINQFSPSASEGSMSAELAKKRFELARQGTPQYFLWQSLHKDGSVVELDVMLKAVRVGDKRFVLATLLDITDRRRAEIELRRAEKNVSEAREHLAHVARLSTMGEMAAGIAHEINQPLSAISTYAQACKRLLQQPTVVAKDFSEPLEKISTQAMRAGEVIRRLRGFVKKSDSGTELLQCNQLVREIVKLAEVDARKFDIPVELNLQERLPSLRVDPIQIQQVILNLIRNALEAMSDTPRDFAKVILFTETTPSGQVCIRVMDRGPGLSDESVARVFHPFFTTKAAGMGLGLSISQSIIQAHGGSLSAYNNPSRGATFVVVLPAAIN